MMLRRSVAAVVLVVGAFGASAGHAQESLAGIAEDWVAPLQPYDPEILQDRLRGALPQEPGALHWADADMPAALKAGLIVAQAEPSQPHMRLVITLETEEFIPQGAGGAVTLSLVKVRRVNLGPARRAALVDELGAAHVAPSEVFGTAPHVEWRFAMRPLQGMRADVLAAGRQELTDGHMQDATCVVGNCLSAAPFEAAAGAEEYMYPSWPDLSLPTERPDWLAAMALLIDIMQERGTDSNPAATWLIETGLWQDDAAQAVLLDHSGRAMGRVLALDGGRIFLSLTDAP